jgi:hypothetical protein
MKNKDDKTEIKKPLYCKDTIQKPYKLCWTYALSIKGFENEYCKKCCYYKCLATNNNIGDKTYDVTAFTVNKKR